MEAPESGFPEGQQQSGKWAHDILSDPKRPHLAIQINKAYVHLTSVVPLAEELAWPGLTPMNRGEKGKLFIRYWTEQGITILDFKEVWPRHLALVWYKGPYNSGPLSLLRLMFS